MCKLSIVFFLFRVYSIDMWAKTEPIFNHYYEFNQRCGCMYCPMSSMSNLAYLYVFYPEQYKYFMDECKKDEEKTFLKYGKLVPVFQSNPTYTAEYYDNRVRSVYVPKLLEQMKADNTSS